MCGTNQNESIKLQFFTCFSRLFLLLRSSEFIRSSTKEVESTLIIVKLEIFLIDFYVLSLKEAMCAVEET